MEDDLLTADQKRILESVANDPEISRQFFLTGGTALSYFYFQHRFSEDLDFFTEQEYNSVTLLKRVTLLGKSLHTSKIEQQVLRGQDIFYFYFERGVFVKVDFAYFPFPHFGNFLKFKGLKVSSIEDIALNKLQAVISRKRSRDYLDLYFCLEKLGWDIRTLQLNYKNKFDVFVSHEQLSTSFTNVLDSSDLPRFLGKVDWKKVENYFLNLSERLKKEIITPEK